MAGTERRFSARWALMIHQLDMRQCGALQRNSNLLMQLAYFVQLSFSKQSLYSLVCSWDLPKQRIDNNAL